MSHKQKNQKILIYAQDIGGAKFIAPIISHFTSKYETIVVVHPFSETVFRKYGMPYYPLSQFFNNFPPSALEIESFVINNDISHVLCTLSSPHRDLTNSYLIKKCRELNIPTMGLMDHWKGYDRFYDQNGEMSYLPEFIVCIDKCAVKEIEKLYIHPEKIFIIGHPHLEKLSKQRKKFLREYRNINILIVSQPDTKDKGFQSIFVKESDAGSITDKIINEIKKMDDGYISIKYRPHPNEKLYTDITDRIDIDTTKDWENALAGHDIFIGLDSMLLVEASVAGKYCISLKLSEFSDIVDVSIPYKFSEPVKNMEDVGAILQKAITMVRQGYRMDISDLEQAIEGSLDRAIHCIENFMTQ